MIAGYHAAGLLLHDPHVAISELAKLGFRCVAVKPHPNLLNPSSAGFGEQVLRLETLIRDHALQLILDLDAFYVHDPWQREGPSLAAVESDESDQAFQWVARWIEIAAELNASLVTFASGASQGIADSETQLDRLASQCERLQTIADTESLQLALRPCHGHVVATVAQFERLQQWLGSGNQLGLAADVGEMLRGGELPLTDRLVRNLDSLACVYLCDRKTGIFGDQPIGQGDVALAMMLRSLKNHKYHGPAIARVEGHSELGLSAARSAIAVMREVIPTSDHTS